MVQKEQKQWQKFLGHEIMIPAPSQELIQTLNKAKSEGLTIFDAPYLPPITFSKDSSYPGWKEKPSDDFWEAITDKEIAKDAASLKGEWILIDKSSLNTHEKSDKCSKVVYGTDDPTFSCPTDPLNKFSSEDHHPYDFHSVRYGDLDAANDTKKNVSLELEVNNTQVRFPRAIEWNVLSNIFYKEWTKKEHSEYFADGEPNSDDYFYGGSDEKGVQQFHHNVDDEWQGEPRAFRPVIVFSQ